MTIAPVDCSGTNWYPSVSVDADLRRGDDPHQGLVVLEVGARRVAPRVAASLILAEAQLAADALVDVLGGGLGHLRGEAVDAEHVVVGAVDLQTVGQL